jgi:DNA-binding GntR family transcriptional regulator
VIVDAVLAGTIRAGTQFGAQALASGFESRMSVREALIRLETRGIVQVGPRRGSFVVEQQAMQETFHARCAPEMGIWKLPSTFPSTFPWPFPPGERAL